MNQRTYVLFQCAICDTKTQQCCSKCKGPFYCSRDHQKLHWQLGHRNECAEEQLNKLRATRTELRKQVLQGLKDGIADFSSQMDLITTSQRIFDKSHLIEDHYELMADSLLLPKILIKNDESDKAHKVLCSISEPLYREKINQADLLKAIASLFLELGDFDNAERFMHLLVSFGDKHQMMKLSEFYFHSGRLRKALTLLQSIQFEEEDQFRATLQQASIHSYYKNYNEAKYYYEQALQDRRYLSDYQKSDILERLAEIHTIQGDTKSAWRCMEHCYELRSQLNYQFQKTSDQLKLMSPEEGQSFISQTSSSLGQIRGDGSMFLDSTFMGALKQQPTNWYYYPDFWHSER